MFSTIRSFRHLLAGCACLFCLSAAAAQEEPTTPAASHATTAAPKVITLKMHGDIKRHYLPTTALTSYPNIFASDDTDYFLVLSVADEAFRFFVISWDSMCPTLIEEDWIDVVYGGYTCSDDMTERDSNLDIQRADMYKNYFALYCHGDRVQYYRADGKRIATVWEANTVRDKADTENPNELPAYFELKQKIENGGAGSKAEVFQSNADIPSVQKAWEERESAGLYYTQEKGKLIFHSAGQSSVVADISNKPILKEYKRRMTEEMSVFIWLSVPLSPQKTQRIPIKGSCKTRSGMSSLRMQAGRPYQKRQYPAHVIIRYIHTGSAARRSSLPSPLEIMFSYSPGSVTTRTLMIIVRWPSMLSYPRRENNLHPFCPRIISSLFPTKYIIRTFCFQPTTRPSTTSDRPRAVQILSFCRAKTSMNDHPHRRDERNPRLLTPVAVGSGYG